MDCRNSERAAILASLQTDILRLQGFKTAPGAVVDPCLGPMRYAFPNASFPVGCVHEFVAGGMEDGAATGGFVAGLLSSLMGPNGAALWISAGRTLFPPALRSFGLSPDRFIFVDLHRDKDVMWVMDEALKCGALAAVVGELRDLSFTASRRLQLAVEHSGVTGFVLRRPVRHLSTTACVSRWRITPLASEPVEGLPGMGFPQWRVELQRIRNGRPGVWNIRWEDGKFCAVADRSVVRVAVDSNAVFTIYGSHQKTG